MSFFGDEFESRVGRLKLTQCVRDLFKVVTKAEWKAKVTLWDPKTGEEWEITPVGSRQTKRPSIHVEVIVTPDEDQDSPI